MIIIDLLKLNEETKFGNIFTEEDAKLIIDTVNCKPYSTFGELDPVDNYGGNYDTSLIKASHCLSKLWIDDNRIWGNVTILSTHLGKIISELINEIDFSKLSAINRENQMTSVIEDNIESNWIYPSDLFKEKGLYFSLRGAQLNGKLTKFFTFDIRTIDTQTLFVDN